MHELALPAPGAALKYHAPYSWTRTLRYSLVYTDIEGGYKGMLLLITWASTLDSGTPAHSGAESSLYNPACKYGLHAAPLQSKS